MLSSQTVVLIGLFVAVGQCDSSKYIGVDDYSKTWDEANEYCESEYGTTLATIESYIDYLDAIKAAKDSGIFDGITKHPNYKDRFFIGDNDEDRDDHWVYRGNHNVDYTYNAVIGGDGQCTEIIYSQNEVEEINDLPCNDPTRYFVCDKYPQPIEKQCQVYLFSNIDQTGEKYGPFDVGSYNYKDRYFPYGTILSYDVQSLNGHECDIYFTQMDTINDKTYVSSIVIGTDGLKPISAYGCLAYFYTGIDFTGDKYGPFDVNDYKPGDERFDTNKIQSITIKPQNGYACGLEVWSETHAFNVYEIYEPEDKEYRYNRYVEADFLGLDSNGFNGWDDIAVIVVEGWQN